MSTIGEIVVLFIADFDDNVTDVWRFDGSSWSELPESVPPTSLYAFGAATTAEGEVLLYGGYTGSDGSFQDRSYLYGIPLGWQDLGPYAGPATYAAGSTPCLMGAIP
jgi:hypothetical protein